MQIALVGSTWATEACRKKLDEHGYPPRVFTEHWSARIAGQVEFEDAHQFTKIGEIVEALNRFDMVFVCGFSQIVPPLSARAVGFHPTRLPRGRGRAPIAWLVLGAAEGAATFFELTPDVDAGPIFVQENFEVDTDHDYAIDVCDRIVTAMGVALDRWLPHLGEWEPVPQDESLATWLPARRPADGEIDWTRSPAEVYALIRAASWPHPGAYSNGIRIERASLL